MPNTNPAGPFQPMNQHPTPSFRSPTVGRDGAFLHLDGAGEFLLLAPPAPGVVRSLQRVPPTVLFYNRGTDPVDFVVYAKDQQDRQIILGGPDTVNPGSTGIFLGPLQDVVPFFMMNGTLKGLFIELSGGPNIAIDATIPHDDRRNVTEKVVELSASFQTVTPEVPPGQVAVMNGFHNIVSANGYWVNFDNIPHSIEVEYFDADNNIFPLATPTAPIGIGPVSPQGALAYPWGDFSPYGPPVTLVNVPLPPGSGLRARLLEANTEVVAVYSYYAFLNQSPTRTYQGGAY